MRNKPQVSDSTRDRQYGFDETLLISSTSRSSTRLMIGAEPNSSRCLPSPYPTSRPRKQWKNYKLKLHMLLPVFKHYSWRVWPGKIRNICALLERVTNSAPCPGTRPDRWVCQLPHFDSCAVTIDQSHVRSHDCMACRRIAR